MATAAHRSGRWWEYDRVERAKIRLALKDGMARKDIKRIFGPYGETLRKIEQNTNKKDDLSEDADYASGTKTIAEEARHDAFHGERSTCEDEGDEVEVEDEAVIEDDGEWMPARRGQPPGRSRYKPYPAARPPGRPRKSDARGHACGGPGVRGQKSHGRHGALPTPEGEIIAPTVHPEPEVVEVKDDEPIDPIIPIDPVRRFLQEMRLESDVRVEGLKAVGIDSAEKIDQLRSMGREALDAMFNQKSQISTALLARGFSQFELGIMCFKVAGTG